MSNYKPGQMVKFVHSRELSSRRYVGTPAVVVKTGGVMGWRFNDIGLRIMEEDDMLIEHIDGFRGTVQAWQVEPIVDDGSDLFSEESELVNVG